MMAIVFNWLVQKHMLQHRPKPVLIWQKNSFFLGSKSILQFPRTIIGLSNKISGSEHRWSTPSALKLKKDGAKMIWYYPRNRRILIILVRLPAGLCSCHYSQPASSTSRSYLTFTCEKSIERDIVVSVTNLTDTSYCSDSGWPSRHPSLFLVLKSVLLFETELPKTQERTSPLQLSLVPLGHTEDRLAEEADKHSWRVIVIYYIAAHYTYLSVQNNSYSGICLILDAGIWCFFLIVSYPGESLANTNQFMDKRCMIALALFLNHLIETFYKIS